MAYTVVQSCPPTFPEWQGQASSTCRSGTYHCMEDEYSRAVEVCDEPIWIEPGILLWTLYLKQNIHFYLVVL